MDHVDFPNLTILDGCNPFHIDMLRSGDHASRRDISPLAPQIILDIPADGTTAAATQYGVEAANDFYFAVDEAI